jgi:hypothetical protein
MQHFDLEGDQRFVNRVSAPLAQAGQGLYAPLPVAIETPIC